jgi:hypothetical protein
MPQPDINLVRSLSVLAYESCLPAAWHIKCIGMHDCQQPGSDRCTQSARREEHLMDTKQRSGWATAMIALAVLVGAAFVLFLLMTLVGILD